MNEGNKREAPEEKVEVGTDKEKEILPLTKFQKFKNLFKQTDTSLELLGRQLKAITIFLVVSLLIGFGSSTGAILVSFMLADMFLPLQKEYIETSAWKINLVYVPVVLIGTYINYYVHGGGAINTIIAFAFLLRILQAIAIVPVAIFFKYKKILVHNIVVSVFSLTVLYVSFAISVAVFS